jgi:hypothetical protein
MGRHVVGWRRHSPESTCAHVLVHYADVLGHGRVVWMSCAAETAATIATVTVVLRAMGPNVVCAVVHWHIRHRSWLLNTAGHVVVNRGMEAKWNGHSHVARHVVIEARTHHAVRGIVVLSLLQRWEVARVLSGS